MLNGKPLLQYTVEAVKQSKKLDHCILSTEDTAIIEVAKSIGLDVPFIRPSQLAQDKSPTLPVLQHALEFYKAQGIVYDAVCLLQVTNPFRTSEFIDEAINTFIENRTDSLISVLEVPHEFNPHWTFEEEKGKLKIATGEKEIITRRQDLPKAFYRDGSIYITKAEVLLQKNSLYGESISYIQANPERHVNIDTMQDWERAEELSKKLY